MFTETDSSIINFVEQYGGITIKQCGKLFYKSKYGDDLARKRLKKLADLGYLKRERDWATNQQVYYGKKKPSSHTIMLMNFYAELLHQGANIIEFQREYKIENVCRPDALVAFEYDNKGKLVFIEVDMSHKTDLSKYEKLFDMRLFQKEYGTFPEIILISSTKEYDIKKLPFSVKILDYSLSNFRETILIF